MVAIDKSPIHLPSRIRSHRDPMAKRARILVGDDLPSNLKLMRVLVSSAGYGVSTAVNEKDALLAAMDEAPDLIVTDLHATYMKLINTRTLKNLISKLLKE